MNHSMLNQAGSLSSPLHQSAEGKPFTEQKGWVDLEVPLLPDIPVSLSLFCCPVVRFLFIVRWSSATWFAHSLKFSASASDLEGLYGHRCLFPCAMPVNQVKDTACVRVSLSQPWVSVAVMALHVSKMEVLCR